MLKAIKKTYFVFIPILITAILLALKMVRYGAVDDVLLYDVATSYPTNAHSEHVMFLSVIFGFVVKLLYSVTGAVNWFSVLYLLLLNAAFIVYFKIVEKHGSNLVLIAVISFIQVYLLMRISFTVIAFTNSVAGILWFIEYVDKLNKSNLKHMAVSFLFLFSAFIMRSNGVLLCVILIFIPLFFFCIKEKKNSIAAVALIICLAVVANLGVIGVQQVYRTTIPDELYYKQFQQYRSAASDEGSLSYRLHKEEYKKAGLTKNDIAIFKQFVYIDKEAYSAEKVEAIAKSRDMKDRFCFNIKDIVRNAYKLERHKSLNTLFYYALAAIILFILFKKKRLEIFSSSVFLAAAEAYLFVRKRGVARVVHPIALVGIILLIYIVRDEQFDLSVFKFLRRFDAKIIATAVGCVALAGAVLFSAYTLRTYDSRFHNYSNVIDYAQKDSEHLYLSFPLTRDKLMDHHLTLLTKDYQTIPIYVVSGDWWAYSYYWYDLMEQLDLSEYNDKAINVFLKDNVRLMVFNNGAPDKLVNFYKRHYKLKVTYDKVYNFDEWNIGVYEFHVVN